MQNAAGQEVRGTLDNLSGLRHGDGRIANCVPI